MTAVIIPVTHSLVSLYPFLHVLTYSVMQNNSVFYYIIQPDLILQQSEKEYVAEYSTCVYVDHFDIIVHSCLLHP